MLSGDYKAGYGKGSKAGVKRGVALITELREAMDGGYVVKQEDLDQIVKWMKYPLRKNRPKFEP